MRDLTISSFFNRKMLLCIYTGFSSGLPLFFILQLANQYGLYALQLLSICYWTFQKIEQFQSFKQLRVCGFPLVRDLIVTFALD